MLLGKYGKLLAAWTTPFESSFASKSTSGGATKVQNQGTSIKVDKVGTEANKHLPKPSKMSTKATYRTYQSTQSNPRRLPSGYNPPTAYSLFVKNNWKLSKIAGSSQKIADVSKQLAQEWKQCDESEKAAFKSEARKEGEDRRSYFDNLPVNEKEDLEQKSSQHKLSILKRERRSINREINQKTSRPSKPPSAYNLYVKDKLKNRSSGESQTLSQRVTAVALEWKNLPDLDKEKYTSQAAIFAKGYQEKLIKWKEETETVAREIRLENKEKLLKLSQKIKQLELKMPVKGA